MSEKCQTLVAEGDAIQQDPIAQQHELLVSEIESTDGHLGTALRFVAMSAVVITVQMFCCYSSLPEALVTSHC